MSEKTKFPQGDALAAKPLLVATAQPELERQQQLPKRMTAKFSSASILSTSLGREKHFSLKTSFLVAESRIWKEAFRMYVEPSSLHRTVVYSLKTRKDLVVKDEVLLECHQYSNIT